MPVDVMSVRDRLADKSCSSRHRSDVEKEVKFRATGVSGWATRGAKIGLVVAQAASTKHKDALAMVFIQRECKTRTPSRF